MNIFGRKSRDDSPVTDEEVLWAYRIALGREPESERAVAQHRRAANLLELRQTFFNSIEFRNGIGRTIISQIAPTFGATTAPDIVSPDRADLRDRMFRHIAKSWSNYGDTEAHWSVLTMDRFREETLKENLDEFNQSGTSQVKSFQNALARNGLVLPKGGTCIELGCGVGRITRWLAPLFEKVIALDVSAGHLALAKEYVGQHASNVEFRQLRSIEDLEQLPPAEAFYTFLVLQHNPPPVIEGILDRIFARLAPQAIAYVHLPTFIPDYHFDAEEYLAEREERLDMEMHMLPQKDVFRLIASHDMQLLEVLNQTNELMMVADCIVLKKA